MKIGSSIADWWNSISNKYTNKEWLFLKIALVLYWRKFISNIDKWYHEIPIPSGICDFIPCDFIVSHEKIWWIWILTQVLCILYVFEKKMLWTTFLMFILSLMMATVEESNGVHLRRGLFTFIFFAQFLAYWLAQYKGKEQLKQNRIHFSVQVIVVGYMLAAFSKLWQSGIGWVADGARIPLQIIKSFHYVAIDDGNMAVLQEGFAKAAFLQDHYGLILFFLGASLLLECFVFIALFGKKYAVLFGLLLLSMHIGIHILMDIAIGDIIIPMVIVFINPLFLIFVFFKKSRRTILSKI